jgi:hypothetical protein
MPLHQQLQERLASNCRITRRDADGGLPPSMPWLQELAPAVAASGGLIVGGLRAHRLAPAACCKCCACGVSHRSFHAVIPIAVLCNQAKS